MARLLPSCVSWVHKADYVARVMLHTASDKAKEELEGLQKRKEEVESKMADLKKILYGKFGQDKINLEE